LKDKTAEGVAKKLEYSIRIISAPEILQADNGREFRGAVYILLRKIGVKIKHGRPRTPQTQGLVERGNATVEHRISR